MKKRKREEITVKKINIEQVVTMMNFFRIFFDKEEDFNDLVNYIVDYYKNVDYDKDL